ncbi:preprotein translocase subunit SecE [Actinokineospora pegani]|uniref:preprotein translocase subunit SecE n=1 Tax=Actinokineospora pegani TaxID=2654637 RepID=UPI0012E9A8AB|nr:preprotein translocase subunit SecE [Actinokineospora pegani]
MAEDKDREEGQQDDAPRPSSAASRRERRGTSRPASSNPKDDDGGPQTEKVPVVRPEGKAKPSDAEKSGKAKKSRPTPSRERKPEKVGFFSRIFRFLREVVAELRKVIWPTRKQMVTYTAVVLVFVAFMVALISGLDLALGQGVSWLFG